MHVGWRTLVWRCGRRACWYFSLGLGLEERAMPRSPGPENGITWGKVAKAQQSTTPLFGRVFCSAQCWRFDSTWRAGWVMMVVGVDARRPTFVACLTCQFAVTKTVGRTSPKDDAADSSFLSFVTYTRYLVQADTLYDYGDSGNSGDSSNHGVLKDCRSECGLERAHKGGQAFKVSREIYRFAVTC